MAHTVQAKKRTRQIKKHTQINRMRRNRVRTFMRLVEDALQEGDKAAAMEALRLLQPEIMRGVTKGIFHKNTASRHISRINNRIRAIT